MLNKIFKKSQDGLTFFVYLTPGSQKEEITGVMIDIEKIMIKIAVHARPTDNQANISLIKFVSEKFKTAKSNVYIKQGLKSRKKQICIKNLEITDIPEEVFKNLRENNNQLSLF